MREDRSASPISDDPRSRQLLALTLVSNLGPVLIDRLLERFGSPESVLGATASALSSTRGIGGTLAAQIARDLSSIQPRIDEELELIQRHNARVVTLFDEDYPSLLAQLPGAPPVLTVRGALRPNDRDRYTISIVGSRRCTLYGSEQASRFAAALTSSGLTVVSGGARGIDTAAHKGALSANGRTTVVLGCGLAHTYPPENERLFSEIVERGGAIVSELPIRTAPIARNFPARNRIISGMSLGVIVIEAAKGSGALITARHATEDHGREVMSVPGRVDAPASAGSNELLKNGAHLVTDPSDVLEILERDARHLYAGTHHARTANPSVRTHARAMDAPETAVEITDATERAIIDGLDEERTGDELAELLSMPPGEIRAKLTMLEISGRVRRAGSRFRRT